MTISPPRLGSAPDPGVGFREFVGLIAALMAVSALGIDSMLTALPDIAHSLAIANENDRQWIIAVYMFGFGSAQLVYGPLADRYGRKPVLLITLVLFAAMSVLAGLSGDFHTLLAARFLQGVTIASSRVLSISIVRDCYAGRQMARVMSLSFIVFLSVPILAPSIGQVIMLVAPWRAIFFALAAYSVMLFAWITLRLKETLHPDYRRPISVSAVSHAARLVLTRRYSIGYTLGSTLVFGSLMGYINSIQQIFADVFHRPELMTIVFAGVASTMAGAAFFNSHVVERLGSRKVSHTALLVFIAVAGVHMLLAVTGREYLWSFSLLQAMQFACFAMIGSNFGSMAMEPVGEVAGTAASIQGFISTVVGSLIGVVIGQQFDGTTVPVMMGFFIVSLVALGVVLVTERGRLFRPHHPATVVAA